MKLGLLALPAAFLLTFVALMVGCGGDADTLTLDEYFARFEAIDADVDAQIEAVYADFPEAASDEEIFADEANLPFFKNLIAAFPRIIADSIDRAADLEPPSEVEDAHNDLLDAGRALLVAFEEGTGILEDANTMAEFAALNDEVEARIDPAVTRFDNACLALVDIGEANGITVNVTCEDDA